MFLINEFIDEFIEMIQIVIILPFIQIGTARHECTHVTFYNCGGFLQCACAAKSVTSSRAFITPGQTSDRVSVCWNIVVLFLSFEF